MFSFVLSNRNNTRLCMVGFYKNSASCGIFASSLLKDRAGHSVCEGWDIA